MDSKSLSITRSLTVVIKAKENTNIIRLWCFDYTIMWNEYNKAKHGKKDGLHVQKYDVPMDIPWTDGRKTNKIGPRKLFTTSLACLLQLDKKLRLTGIVFTSLNRWNYYELYLHLRDLVAVFWVHLKEEVVVRFFRILYKCWRSNAMQDHTCLARY